jgi:hypothetical protein
VIPKYHREGAVQKSNEQQLESSNIHRGSLGGRIRATSGLCLAGGDREILGTACVV